jgi:hypothetical protein
MYLIMINVKINLLKYKINYLYLKIIRFFLIMKFEYLFN